MTKTYAVCIIVLCLLFSAQEIYGQGKGHSLGKTKDVFDQLRRQANAVNKRMSKPTLELTISKAKSLTGTINFKQSTDQSEYIVGSIQNDPGSDFFLKVNATSIEGSIVQRNSKKAYTYFSDASGNAFVEEVNINEVVCIEYDHASGTAPAEEPAGPSVLALTDLQSFPGANGCVLLDFDGQYVSGTPWNGGNPINAQPSGMSDAAVQEAWEIVAEDFRPFSINITTNEAVFNSYPKNRRMRCIITPTNTAAPGAGGVAYLNSFSWNDDTPCWVFITSAKSCGEASSHEIGHTLSLAHDGRTNPSEGYYAGHGNWAPIMGVGYYRSISQWSRGEYANSNNKEDDLAKIAGATNGVGYRVDDHGNTFATARPIARDAAGSVTGAVNRGIIERTGDVDMFSFTTSGGNVTLTINPATRHADLDILARLYNQAGSEIAFSNPAGLNATITSNLAAGTYYVSIDGTGYLDPLSTGYSDYASLGFYTLSGTIPATTINQPPVVSVTNPVNGSSYVAPAIITLNATASDPDGTVSRVEFFSGTTKIGEDLSAPFSFTWAAVPAGTYSITARATDNAGAIGNSPAIIVYVTNPPVNQAPVVSIISPANGASYVAPATVTINASATDSDGSVVRVEFFSAGAKIGEDISAPYSFVWNSVAAGNYALTAIATDNAGARSISDTVIVRVTNPVNQIPSVSITSPVNGSVYVAPATITINASASDPDGTITRVEFFNGSVKLGEDLTAPYTYIWSGVAAGSYTITARAADNSGAMANASVTISVNEPVVTYCDSRGNSTRYEHIQYVNLGTINNTSGNNSGYGNFTSLSTTVTKGSSYTINFRTGYAGSVYTENWAIRMDLNRDGDFTDAGELLVSGTTNRTTTYSATFTIPTTAVAGNTRLRVSMKYGGAPAACETFGYGEVEDYTVIISDPSAIVVPDFAQLNNGDPINTSLDALEEITLHPNPAQQFVVVDLNYGDEILSGKVVDAFGKIVKTFEGSGPRIQVNVEDLKHGTYVMIIKSVRGENARKFIKL